MTRELIEDFAKIVKPFVQKRLLEENFEGMGEQDKAEFGRDFDEILSLAIKGLDQEPNTWSLDDAREDFMHDVYNELDFLPTNEEANRIIDIFDRVTSSIEQAPRWIPVTERLPEEMFGCLVTVWDANPKTGEEFENILPEFAGYDGETWNGADGKPIAFEVVAWMPLPEPYKEDKE